jgi:hypothetical protein
MLHYGGNHIVACESQLVFTHQRTKLAGEDTANSRYGTSVAPFLQEESEHLPSMSP